MKYLLLILLTSRLCAYEMKTREFQVRDSVGIEVFRDKKMCCPEVGTEQLAGDDVKLFNAIRKLMVAKKVEILSATIFYDEHNLPEKFDIESPGKDLPVVSYGGPSGWHSCCVYGSIHTKFDEGGGVVEYQVAKSSSTYGWDEDSPWEDHELMHVSRTSTVVEKIWQHQEFESKDEMTEFLNTTKGILDFKFQDGNALFYLSKVKQNKIDFIEENYNFDREDEVLGVWIADASDVFHKYWDGSQEESKNKVTGMNIYKRWLVIHTDSKNFAPSPMSDYYLKRIKHKWVVVFDGGADVDPRFGGWVPKKENDKEPGIKWEDIPKSLRK